MKKWKKCLIKIIWIINKKSIISLLLNNLKNMRNTNIDILNVTTLEEEIALIMESEAIWWETDAREAYLKWLEKIKNLKI